MRNIAFILALALLGNTVEAKCTPGDDKCLSETSDDEALLQSRTVVEDEEDSMEDSVLGEMENEESVLEEMDDSEMDDSEEEVEIMLNGEGLDWRDMLTDEGVAFMDSDEAKKEEYPWLYEDENEILDEASEIEDTADEVEDSSEETEVEEDRGRRRKGGVFKKVSKAAKKVVKVVKKALPSFSTLWRSVTSKVKGMNSFPSCGNVNDCKNKLIRGPAQLFNRIAQEAGKQINSAVNRLVGKAGRAVQTALGRAKSLIKQTKSKVAKMGSSMSKVLKGATKAIKRAKLDWCTPRGMGYWNFKGTDCGAFSALSQLVKGQGSLSSVIRKFANCAAKTAFSFMWTPFMDIVVKTWCAPSFIRAPVEYLVGSVQAAFAGGGNGVFKSMKNGLNSIIGKLKKMFAGLGLLQDMAAVVGATLHNDTSRYSIDSEAKCSGNDFEASIELAGGFTWKAGHGMGAGITFTNGCWRGKYFFDIKFGMAGTYYLAGALPDLKGLDKVFGGGVTLGFNIGRPDRKTQTAFKGSMVFSGTATIGGVSGALGLSFDVLPGAGAPHGFSVTPEFLAGLNEERQQEIDTALAQHDNDEDKLVAGVATLIQQFDNLDLTHVMEHGTAMLQEGATTMKENTEEQEAAWPMIKELSLSAGLAQEWCFTCKGT